MDVSEFNEKLYSRSFESRPARYHKAMESKAARCVSLLEGSRGRILDIGCGDGFIAEMVGRSTGAGMFGVDISRSALAAAKRRGIEVRRCDLGRERLPFPGRFFDAVLCGDIIEHVFDTDGLLAEARRVLRPGGALVVSIPNLAAWYNRVFLAVGWMPFWVESSGSACGNPFVKEVYGHVRAFTRGSLVDVITRSGFRVDVVCGAPINGAGGCLADVVWGAVDRLFASKASLASFVIVRARKPG